MPRSRSSGALSIWSYAVNVAPPVFARILVIAAVSDVLPWSTWPIVPMLQCGLFRSNFAFVMVSRPSMPQNLTHKSGAGDGNRTRIASLEGWSSTIELHPQLLNRATLARCTAGGGGRIRTFVDAKSADLQSAAIDRSATPPNLRCAARV